jgi:hypothetical protein
MSECSWCHEPVSEYEARTVPPLLASLGDDRRACVEQTWGSVPEVMCARDFHEMASHVNGQVVA